jgi:hypothetical protein
LVSSNCCILIKRFNNNLIDEREFAYISKTVERLAIQEAKETNVSAGNEKFRDFVPLVNEALDIPPDLDPISAI